MSTSWKFHHGVTHPIWPCPLVSECALGEDAPERTERIATQVACFLKIKFNPFSRLLWSQDSSSAGCALLHPITGCVRLQNNRPRFIRAIKYRNLFPSCWRMKGNHIDSWKALKNTRYYVSNTLAFWFCVVIGARTMSKAVYVMNCNSFLPGFFKIPSQSSLLSPDLSIEPHAMDRLFYMKGQLQIGGIFTGRGFREISRILAWKLFHISEAEAFCRFKVQYRQPFESGGLRKLHAWLWRAVRNIRKEELLWKTSPLTAKVASSHHGGTLERCVCISYKSAHILPVHLKHMDK